jgi:2-polyprenyl-3-methyl-5-hydroxy-6-metoxy-1,4-benzoquinol methylase
MVTCRCGLSFVSPRLPDAELMARLQDWAVQDTVDAARLALAFEPATMALYARHVDRLTRALGKPGRLLDVGCATGAFMVAARDKGWAVEGLEVGQASAAFARDHHGLRVTQGSLYDGAPDAPFDAVALLEVVEHLPAPVAALRKLRSWLRPGGRLFLTTPNFDSLFRRLHGPKWWVVNCEDEHIVLFTPSTMQRALQQAGFTVEWLDTRSIDHAGLLAQARRGSAAPAAQPVAVADDQGYYAARRRKTALKSMLGRAGMLTAARAALRGQDWLLSARGSPIRGLGEQIVLLARRDDDPPEPGAR